MPPRSALLILLILLPMIAIGCNTAGDFGTGQTAWTPEAKLALGRQAFNAAVDSLAALREQGTFDAGQAETIGRYIDLGQKLLDRWQAAQELGQPTAGIIEDFSFVLRELIAARNAAGPDA